MALLLVVNFGSAVTIPAVEEGFTFHAAGFLFTRLLFWNHRGILNNAIEDYNLRFISSGVIGFYLHPSLIALILTIKLS